MKFSKLAQSLLLALLPVGHIYASGADENTTPIVVSYTQGNLPSAFVARSTLLSSDGIRTYASLTVTQNELDSLLVESLNQGGLLRIEGNHRYHFPQLLSHNAGDKSQNQLNWQQLTKLSKLEVQTVGTTKVCLIDSGVQLNHSQLSSQLFSGLSSEYAGFWYQDAIGHGTHLAGLLTDPVFANGEISVEVRKLLRSANGENSIIRDSDLISAIEQCANSGAQVINMSLSSPYFSSATRDVIDRLAYDRDIIFVAAAGNHGIPQSDKGDYLAFPAAYRNVIAVGAIDENTDLAYFSAENASIDLVAPGVNIRSTMTNRNRVTAVSNNVGNKLHFVQIDNGTQDFPNELSLVENCLVALPKTLLDEHDTQYALSPESKQWLKDATDTCADANGSGIVFTYDVGIADTTISKIDFSTSFPTLLIPNLTLTHGSSETFDLQVDVNQSEYAVLSGTSQAAAIVSAGIAKLKSANPNVDRETLIQALFGSAEDLGQQGRDGKFGFGLVDFYKANQVLNGEIELPEQGINHCPASWYSNRAYTQGERVAFGRFVYEASYWSKNQNPLFSDGDYEAWSYIGECDKTQPSYTADFDSDYASSGYQLSEIERITVVYSCESYTLACGGGNSGGGFGGFISWGYGGGSGFSDGGGGGGGSSSSNQNSQKEKEAKQFKEDAGDITNVVAQFQLKLKQILNGLDPNSSAYKQVNGMLQNLGKLADRLNSGVQGFSHAWNGEGQEALAEALAFVVAVKTGKTIDAVGRMLGKNPVVAVGKAAVSVGFSYAAGNSVETAVENFVYDTYVKDAMTAASYYQKVVNKGNEILNDMRCGYQRVTRPDMLCREHLRSIDLLDNTYIVMLDLDNNGVRWQSAQADREISLGQSDGMLFIDFNGSGELDSVNEVHFGHADTQLDTLLLLDSNRDLKIDALDSNFDRLMVWQDLNADGRVNSDESISAASLGLVIHLETPSLQFTATTHSGPVGLIKSKQ
ncbi:S8 family peptidase [Pseudoalteromonas maricaloris]|uniref:S8 family peptidase n=1 Tax=Pseudoalteromonas maricaloris TaxID=184924 RepID=UPI000299DEC9|nr:S8 family serine peptidase [Pseudoalteromonas flavipulchra]